MLLHILPVDHLVNTDNFHSNLRIIWNQLFEASGCILVFHSRHRDWLPGISGHSHSNSSIVIQSLNRNAIYRTIRSCRWTVRGCARRVTRRARKSCQGKGNKLPSSRQCRGLIQYVRVTAWSFAIQIVLENYPHFTAWKFIQLLPRELLSSACMYVYYL
jgi:hypothetical protein